MLGFSRFLEKQIEFIEERKRKEQEEPTTIPFVRPNLTSNGALGGNAFAVSSDCITRSKYAAYYAVSGDSAHHAWMSDSTTSECRYIFYNPQKLKVSKIVNTYYSSTYSAQNVLIEGSDDRRTWQQIGLYSASAASGTQTLNVNSTKFFKYHKLTFKKSVIRISDIAITAEQLVE